MVLFRIYLIKKIIYDYILIEHSNDRASVCMLLFWSSCLFLEVNHLENYVFQHSYLNWCNKSIYVANGQ